MSAIGQLVDGVFGVKSPTVNVPDYAAQAADPAQSQANTQAEAEAAARRTRRRNIDSYLIQTSNTPPTGSGLYIP